MLGYQNGAVLQAVSISGLAVAFALFVCGITAATLELRWFVGVSLTLQETATLNKLRRLMYTTLALPVLLQGYLVWRFGDFFIPSREHLYFNVRVSMSIQSASPTHPSLSLHQFKLYLDSVQ